jgi:hypothetical protein
MLFNFDPLTFFVSLVVSGIGFVAFMYGRKQRRLPQMACGVALMVYPYFVSNVWLMMGIAVVLIAAMVGLIRLGL